MSNVDLQQHFPDKMAYRCKELKYMSSEIQHPKPGKFQRVHKLQREAGYVTNSEVKRNTVTRHRSCTLYLLFTLVYLFTITPLRAVVYGHTAL